MRYLILTYLMALLPVRAGDLVAVKRALGQMGAQGTIAGRLSETYERQLTSGGPRDIRAELALDVKADASKLVMTWDQTLLNRADSEERSRDRNIGGMPLRDAMKELDPGRTSHLLDQHISLLSLLDQGNLLRTSEEHLDGKPVLRIDLGVPVRVADDFLRARVSTSEGHFSLWIGADDVPVASQLELSYSGRKGRVFGRFQSRSTIRTRYGVMGDRIYVLHRDTAESYMEDSVGHSSNIALDFEAR